MNPSSDGGRIDWPMPRWFVGFWLLFIVGGWWGTTFASLSAVAGPTAMGNLGVPLAVATRLVGFAVEAGFYAIVWRSLGRRLRFWWLYTWVASLSLLDLIAESLRGIGARSAEAATWLAPFVGLGAIDGAFAWKPELGLAFGSLGLLAATRIVGTAFVQARELGVSARKAVALTVGTWAVTRLCMWWTTDLLRGMSPLP